MAEDMNDDTVAAPMGDDTEKKEGAEEATEETAE